MNYSVYIYHFANALNMAAWLVTDILWVRALAVCGNAITILYYSQHLAQYQANVWWHGMYIVINIVQIGVLLYQRRPIHFEERELSLYKLSFAGLLPFDFCKLVRHVHWLNTAEPVTLAQKGVPLDDVSIIVSGSAVVTVDGHLVSELVAGNLIGEISFMQGGPETADVATSSPSVIAQWNKDRLQHLLKRNPSLSNAWQIGMGNDLARKVSFHTEARTQYARHHNSSELSA